MRLAVNPLQCLTLQEDGIGLGPDGDDLGVLREVRDAGFTSVAAELGPGRDVSEYRRALEGVGLAPAPGYFSAPLCEASELEVTLARARSFAVGQRALGLTEACLADDLHPERVRTGPGAHESPSGERLKAAVLAVARIAEVWREAGLTACVHNHVGTYVENAEEIDAVLEGTEPDLVRFCPDTGHLAWAGIEPVEALRRHRDRIGLVHVKDLRAAVLARGSALGWGYGGFVRAGLWAEPGLGDLDLDGVMAELDGYDRWVIVEVDQTPAASARDSLRLCAEWARERARPAQHA